MRFFIGKLLTVLAILALAAFLLFELVPPVTRADTIGVKLVSASELWSASVEGFTPQDTPFMRRLELARQNIAALGIDQQIWWRYVILIFICSLALYSLLPQRFRFMRPIADLFDEAGQKSSIYTTLMQISRNQIFFIIVIALVIGIWIQNEILDTPGGVPALIAQYCSTNHPCSVWSRPFLMNPF
ncbi:hypothetical protein [Methylobacterium aquaticum]|jgi:hypothetical protein|uniref:hypothetical protein n=1 Tax=Methylobacterium aquaticum TaxID=270351 RepID=UPI0012E10614|nr:hypothetical protein [Methylobacterium aquaticum]